MAMRMMASAVLLAGAILVAGAVDAVAAPAARYDLVIAGGHVIDGTGSPWYAADVGIRDGRIAAIGRLPRDAARRVIDVHGQVVAPGFIDMLGQSELALLVDPRAPSKIHQGITTEITGEGESAAPLDARMAERHRLEYQRLGIHADWQTLAQYFARLRRQGIGINFATYVGATSVREAVVGYDDRAATPEELARMQQLVEEAMRQGAMGVSSSLEYPPAPYASTEELIALARAAARHGGIYATHMRSEGDGMVAALEETFRIGREASIPVEIWHLKVAGHRNWGTMPDVVARIEAARTSGVDVSANTYAYTAWSNSMSAFVPPWAHSGGDGELLKRLADPATRARIRADMAADTDAWDNEWREISGPGDVLVCATYHDELRRYQGMRLDAIAAEWHEDPLDALLDLLARDEARTEVAVFGMDEPDVALALRQPWVSVDNDSSAASPEGVLGGFHPHPRAYGTFPRILARYVREQHLLSLPDAIRKFSALPAQKLGLADRGVIKQGMQADLVVFDPATVRDLATYEAPNQLSAGMDYVIVNGVPVIDAGKMTGKLPGQVLLGPGYPRH